MITGRTRLALVNGQAARLVNLFCDVRNMPEGDFHAFLRSLSDNRIRSLIVSEIGPEEIDE